MVPLANSIASTSEVLPQQYYGKWLNFMHQATTSANTPTSLAIWDSTAKASGWSLLAYILTVDTGWSTDVPYFQGTLGNKPFNWDSQLGDPILFEYNGATYMMYETVWMELYDIPSLSVAWWNAPLSSVTAMYFSGSESDNEHKIK